MDTAADKRQTATTFNMEEGIEAVKDLSLNEAEDDKTSVDPSRPRPPGGAGPRGFRGPGGARQVDFPLRILVSSEMVGAIIGRGGATIRTITQQSRARVDVHRKVDHMGSVEKAITVYGQPENCTTACQRICEVMAEEAKNVGKSEEITLKLLAHNNLIGRIIGKQGATIKRIMEDTDTKITVSSINDISSFNLERIITIKGTIPNMSRAEAEVSSKLRAAYETDLHAMAPQSVMFPGLHPAAMMSTVGLGISAPRAPHQQPPQQQQQQPRGPGPQAAVLPSETTYLYIPNTAVGAIIGTKGGHIRNIIKFSGSSVKIAPAEEGEEAAASLPPPASGEPAQRKVTVVGPPESQWKAQYLIFEKLREEGFMAGQDDVRLTVEILVPSSQVGRIIGKGGQNVREMQRLTGAVIKLPEQGTAMGEETSVHIIGPFYSTQSAQRRIRAMVQQAHQPAAQGPGGAVIPGLPAGVVLPGMPANGGSGGGAPVTAQPGPPMM